MKASNKMLKLMVLPQAKARGHTVCETCWISFACAGKFLILTFFVKKKNSLRSN